MVIDLTNQLHVSRCLVRPRPVRYRSMRINVAKIVRLIARVCNLPWYHFIRYEFPPRARMADLIRPGGGVRCGSAFSSYRSRQVGASLAPHSMFETWVPILVMACTSWNIALVPILHWYKKLSPFKYNNGQGSLTYISFLELGRLHQLILCHSRCTCWHMGILFRNPSKAISFSCRSDRFTAMALTPYSHLAHPWVHVLLVSLDVALCASHLAQSLPLGVPFHSSKAA